MDITTHTTQSLQQEQLKIDPNLKILYVHPNKKHEPDWTIPNF